MNFGRRYGQFGIKAQERQEKVKITNKSFRACHGLIISLNQRMGSSTVSFRMHISFHVVLHYLLVAN